ncbi:MAG TPA: hypothetical protein VGH80_11645 [Xanthomonadaceae bacterium]|jgi:hypothetical protein
MTRSEKTAWLVALGILWIGLFWRFAAPECGSEKEPIQTYCTVKESIAFIQNGGDVMFWIFLGVASALLAGAAFQIVRK